MSPSVLWFPFVLILYGEASYCKTTRRCSRGILYAYLSSLMITSYMSDTQLATMLSYFVITMGYAYCIAISERKAGVILFSIMIILMSYISSAVIFRTMEYDIVIDGVSLLAKSSYIYREGSMIALSCVSFLTMFNQRVSRQENILGLIAMTTWMI